MRKSFFRNEKKNVENLGTFLRLVVVGCVEFGDLVQTEHLPDKLEIGLTIALASANTLSISSDSNGSDDRKFSGFCDGLFPVNNMYMRFRWLECVLIIIINESFESNGFES